VSARASRPSDVKRVRATPGLRRAAAGRTTVGRGHPLVSEALVALINSILFYVELTRPSPRPSFDNCAASFINLPGINLLPTWLLASEEEGA
jgi:hypothetical protein